MTCKYSWHFISIPFPWHELVFAFKLYRVVVDLLFIVLPIVCGSSVFVFCFVMHYFVFQF